MAQKQMEAHARALEIELKKHLHPNPILKRPLTEFSLAMAADWIADQKALAEKAKALEQRAKELSFLLPYFEVPYVRETIEDSIPGLEAHAERWAEFDRLERRWKAMRCERAYSVAERKSLDLVQEQNDCLSQEKLWAEYWDCIQAYAHLGLKASVKGGPINRDMIDEHRDRAVFIQRWQGEIKSHKNKLLPKYMKHIDFPKSPFTSEDVERYVDTVRPYLQKSQQIRAFVRWGWILALVTGMAFFLW